MTGFMPIGGVIGTQRGASKIFMCIKLKIIFSIKRVMKVFWCL